MKLIRLTILVLLIVLGVSAVRNVGILVESQKKITEAQKSLASAEAENAALAKKVKDVQSDAYFEAEVRNELGLAREGEAVVVLPDDDTVRAAAPKQVTNQIKDKPASDSNWKLWAKLFF